MKALKAKANPFFNFRKCCALVWLAFAPALALAQDSGASAKRIAATIDVTKTSAPVSPYLYGQFIEHIADTVNRSVWAEMIDDRKFYFTIDSETPAPAASRGLVNSRTQLQGSVWRNFRRTSARWSFAPASLMAINKSPLAATTGSAANRVGYQGLAEETVMQKRHRSLPRLTLDKAG